MDHIGIVWGCGIADPLDVPSAEVTGSNAVRAEHLDAGIGLDAPIAQGLIKRAVAQEGPMPAASSCRFAPL